MVHLNIFGTIYEVNLFYLCQINTKTRVQRSIRRVPINHKDNSFLNHTGENPQGWGYAVFGIVTEGMDIVDQIADVATGSSGAYQDVPEEVITIESVTVSE